MPYLDQPVQPDWQSLLACLRYEGTPERVHNIELFLDPEIKQAVVERFGLGEDLPADAPYRELEMEVRLQRFLGYDYVRQGLEGLEWQFHRVLAEDSADLSREQGRSYIDEHTGPITSWQEFEDYPWPDPHQASTEALEWYSQHLPEDMCIMGSGGFAHFAEHLVWLMGYETLCYALYDQRDLVRAISERLLEIYEPVCRRILAFDRVKIMWGSDDMGYRSGLLISPDDMREFVLPGHRLMARMSHEAGRPYLLHSCGKLDAIMPDLVDEVGIDGKHSFEDTIESVVDFRREYEGCVAALGGIDMDFLCRSDEAAVRGRVRRTLQACMPGGGYCLGTGNSVANYVPLENYLAMLDEGRRWRP
jgi:uroporphyrinogen decarboxylase